MKGFREYWWWIFPYNVLSLTAGALATSETKSIESLYFFNRAWWHQGWHVKTSLNSLLLQWCTWNENFGPNTVKYVQPYSNYRCWYYYVRENAVMKEIEFSCVYLSMDTNLAPKKFFTDEWRHVQVRPCAFYRVSGVLCNIAYFRVAYCGL